MKRNIYALSVILAGTLWGSMGLFVRKLNTYGLTSIQISEIRAVLTTLLLAVILFITKREYLKIRLKDLWIFACAGIFSILLFNVSYFKAIEIMSMSVAATLMYSAPAFVMLMSAALFSEKITPKKIASIIVTFVGCFLVSGIIGSNASISAFGLLCGVGSGFGYALYSIFSRYAINRGYSSLTITMYTFMFAAIGCAFLTDFKGIFRCVQADLTLIPFSVFYAALTTVTPYLLYTYGLSHIENSIASVMSSVEPVVATILGLVVFGEKLSLPALIGILLVLFGIAIMSFKSKKLHHGGVPHEQ